MTKSSNSERDLNRGALFKNDRKQEGETYPDYRGSLNVEGAEWWVSGWLNTSKAGAKYLSLKISRKEPTMGGVAKPAPTADFDDEIPF